MSSYSLSSSSLSSTYFCQQFPTQKKTVTRRRSHSFDRKINLVADNFTYATTHADSDAFTADADDAAVAGDVDVALAVATADWGDAAVSAAVNVGFATSTAAAAAATAAGEVDMIAFF